MIWASITIILVLTLLLLGQLVLVIGYVWRLRKASPRLAESDYPSAAVVLCVRGNDPSLEACVRSIFDQDYPDYRVLFVFDSDQDPGYAVVQRQVAQHPDACAELAVLPSIPEVASLKCSAVVHAVNCMEESDQVVAFIDADSVAHPTWLREMVAPFHDPKVGATTGIRWYEPAVAEMGSVVRAVWNAAAVVQMYWYRVPWGGSLAIRHSLIRESDLLERWSKAFCEDTLVTGELAERGIDVEIVPSLHMVNLERCTLGSFADWVTRQLVTTRLYHRFWPLIAGHGVGTSFALLASLVMLGIAIWFNDRQSVGLLCSGLLAYQLCSLGMLYAIVGSARRVLRKAGRPLEPWGGEINVMYVLGLPVTQLVYAYATLRSLFVKRVQWRGVEYRIDRNGRIAMEGYRPYPAGSEQASTGRSL